MIRQTLRRAISHGILHSCARVLATTSGKTPYCTLASLDSLIARVEILRRKFGGNRVIPSPGDRVVSKNSIARRRNVS